MSPKEEVAQSPEEARGILAKLGYDEEAVRRLLPPAGNGSGTVGSSPAPVEAPETAEALDEVAGLIAKYVVLPSEHEPSPSRCGSRTRGPSTERTPRPTSS